MQGVLYKACLRLFANQLLNALYEFLIYSGIHKMLPHWQNVKYFPNHGLKQQEKEWNKSQNSNWIKL